MNKKLFNSAMARYGDTQESLANAMKLSVSRLNAKINERDGASFDQKEIQFIIDRYNLKPIEVMEIFFAFLYRDEYQNETNEVRK